MTVLRSELEDRSVAAHLIALAKLPGVGPGSLLRWHRGVGAAAALAKIRTGSPDAIRALAGPHHRPKDGVITAMITGARSVDPEEELERHVDAGVRVLVLGQAGYPDRLAQDPAPPAVLFARGSFAALAGPTVAIVGTRNATRVGRDFAAGLGAELTAAGVAVVSGLALGIDAAAHRGALHAFREGIEREAGTAPSAPVAVIASGLDIAYPRRHVELHQEIATAGLLLSEVPLGERPTEWRFPARNRIIAGLSDAVVVAESRSKGGSVLTAGEGLDRGLPVLAVPGHPSAPSSAGTNDLIFDGAGLVRSTRDVLDAIGLDQPVASPNTVASTEPTLSATSQLVLDAIADQPAALAEVVARCGLDLEDVSASLTSLEVSGRVVRTAGWYERVGRGRSRS